ncbi:MAG: hypothetical protein FWF56_00520 [Firmicutes bacterium]|nr:hypothetical protein [Bacillota bacterium]MCL1953752.1 hypothetical protein [Bacillota bacterium]
MYNILKTSKSKKVWVVALIAISLCLTLLLSSNATQALALQQPADVMSKQEFASQHKYTGKKLTRAEESGLKDKYYSIMDDNTLNFDEKEVLLNEIGVYTYQNGNVNVDNGNNDGTFVEEIEIGNDSRNVSDNTRSNPKNAYVNGVTIHYSSSTNSWVLSTSGGWLNNDRENGIGNPWWFVSKGDSFNIGSLDYMGIMLFNTSGSSSGLALIDGLLVTSSYFGQETTRSRHSSLLTTNGAMFMF